MAQIRIAQEQAAGVAGTSALPSSEVGTAMPNPRLVAADDTSVLWGPFAERLKTTDNPRQRKILETLIEHLRAESVGDLEATMATVAPDARFINPFGQGPSGWDEIREHYKAVFAAGGIGNMIVETHRVVVDDHAIVNEYTFGFVVPWRLAKEQGYAIEHAEGHYHVRQHASTMLPFDPEGKLRGEISYGRHKDPLDFERVPDDELSPGYLQWLDNLPAT